MITYYTTDLTVICKRVQTTLTDAKSFVNGQRQNREAREEEEVEGSL